MQNYQNIVRSKRLYPDVWKEFVSLEDDPNVANNKWNVYGKTLREIDEELTWSERQMTIFDFMEESNEQNRFQCFYLR